MRAARSLLGEHVEDTTDEIDHNDIDSGPSIPLLNNPNLITIEPTSPSQDKNTPSAVTKDVEMTSDQSTSPVVEPVDEQMDFNWNMDPLRSPSPSLPDPITTAEPSNSVSTLELLASQSIIQQSVLTSCLLRTVAFPAPSALPLSHPKPKLLAPGASSPDPWTLLGHKQPKTPAPLAPGAKFPIPPNANLLPAISQPPPTSTNVLKLHAAAEAEA